MYTPPPPPPVPFGRPHRPGLRATYEFLSADKGITHTTRRGMWPVSATRPPEPEFWRGAAGLCARVVRSRVC